MRVDELDNQINHVIQVCVCVCARACMEVRGGGCSTHVHVIKKLVTIMYRI